MRQQLNSAQSPRGKTDFEDDESDTKRRGSVNNSVNGGESFCRMDNR